MAGVSSVGGAGAGAVGAAGARGLRRGGRAGFALLAADALGAAVAAPSAITGEDALGAGGRSLGVFGAGVASEATAGGAAAFATVGGGDGEGTRRPARNAPTATSATITNVAARVSPRFRSARSASASSRSVGGAISLPGMGSIAAGVRGSETPPGAEDPGSEGLGVGASGTVFGPDRGVCAAPYAAAAIAAGTSTGVADAVREASFEWGNVRVDSSRMPEMGLLGGLESGFESGLLDGFESGRLDGLLPAAPGRLESAGGTDDAVKNSVSPVASTEAADCGTITAV